MKLSEIQNQVTQLNSFPFVKKYFFKKFNTYTLKYTTDRWLELLEAIVIKHYLGLTAIEKQVKLIVDNQLTLENLGNITITDQSSSGNNDSTSTLKYSGFNVDNDFSKSLLNGSTTSTGKQKTKSYNLFNLLMEFEKVGELKKLADFIIDCEALFNCFVLINY